MKTRIIHTRFWKDDYIASLDVKGKLLFNYLITNEEVNLIGMYELSERIIAFDTGLSIEDIQKLKLKFQQDGRFVFHQSWVRIINVEKYNSYNGEKNQKAKERELSYVPSELMEYDTSIHTSIDTSIIHKSKIKNQKSKIKEEKIEKNDLQEIVQHYNQVFRKNVTSVKGFEGNYKYWAETHSTEKIKLAITNAKQDKYWASVMTLVILFRKKNPRGEEVDYIEDLANRVSAFKPKAEVQKVNKTKKMKEELEHKKRVFDAEHFNKKYNRKWSYQYFASRRDSEVHIITEEDMEECLTEFKKTLSREELEFLEENR